jgi:hypothetical protein
MVLMPQHQNFCRDSARLLKKVKTSAGRNSAETTTLESGILASIILQKYLEENNEKTNL